MKIAILTQPLRVNYGGIMQAYALQTVLQRMGHNVTVINREMVGYPPFYLLILRIVSVLKCFIRVCILGKKDFVVMNPLSAFYHVKWSGYDIQPFVRKKIHQSPEIRSSRRLTKYIIKQKYQCIVVGSDQVWRPCYSPCITDYFLKGLEEFSAKKVAYAASFGSDVWEFSQNDSLECRRLVQNFDAISVRETSAIKLCRDNLNIDAVHVLDPTMLLDVKDYINLVETAKTSTVDGDVFCYILDENVEVTKILQDIEERGLKVFNINMVIEPTTDNSRKFQPIVEQWLRSFIESKFIVTDSFHACVFSIIFNKPFVVWNNVERGSSRFDSLLEMFGLKNRIISSYDDFYSKVAELMCPLNSSEISKTIHLLRDMSLDFLKNAIL